MKIVLLGVEDLLGRLPETLAGSGAEIIVVGPPESYLRHSVFVTRYIVLTPPTPGAGWYATIIHNAEMLAELEGDWYFVGSDGLATAIAQSELPVATKIRLLPTHSTSAFPMMGSKVGFARTMKTVGIIEPETRTVQFPSELEGALNEVGFPAMIKGDQGGGGSAVKRVTRLSDALVPDSWFPIVVQKFVPGPSISVEALFVAGELRGWLYSQALAVAGVHGPSSIRRFMNPPKADFLDGLRVLGAHAQLNGLFNCSLIWNQASQSHALFEVDPRPNAWFQFGPALGVDWAALMRGETVPASPKLGRRGRVIHLYPRSLSSSLRLRQPWFALPWLLGLPGTWSARNRRDAAVNAREAFLVRAAAKAGVVGIPYAVYLRLPRSVSSGMERSGVSAVLRRAMNSRRGQKPAR